MDETPTEAPAATGVALAHPDDPPGLDRLKRRPIIDTIDARTLDLIQRTIAPNCSNAEVGHFLELCAHYELDPFAKEAWCAKGDKANSRLLIMVGRDGLRKIAQRNGLHVDGDVVRAKDQFTICRTPDGNRTVTHSYGNPATRGEVIGAWAECREGGPMGKPMGYFYAPLSEYLPKGSLEYSPWGKQVGVMILAAAERQAIRQATPLGGLLAAGEDELVFEHERPAIGEGVGDGRVAGVELPAEVEAVIARAGELGHAGLADRGTLEMLLGGQAPESVAEWVAKANAELDDVPVDAEVVPDTQEAVVRPDLAQATGGQGEAEDGPQATPQPADVPDAADPDRLAALRRRGEALLEDAEALRDNGDPRADEVFEEAELVMAEVEANTDPDQASLPL